MALSYPSILFLLVGYACAAPANDAVKANKASILTEDLDQAKDDLKTAASNSHSRRSYSDWGGGYPASYGYGVTGYGTIDDKYSSYYSGGIGGYDNTYGYSGYSGGGGYPGYGGYSGSGGYGYSNRDYGGGYGGYRLTGYSGGNGGYGGWGGNGGLNSYYGYNNPSYPGGYHLGYGYQNKRGYDNIYQNGVTPSLVTGYRGYSRR